MFERLWNPTGVRADGTAVPSAGSIVMSLPPAIREGIRERAGAIEETRPALERLFEGAERTLKVFSPYVDPTFTGLVQRARAKIRMVTTVCSGRPSRPNPVLERCSMTRDLTVRYLNEQKDRALMFQMHAKLVLADGACAYVGSANLTDTSLHYNLELGLIIRDKTVLAMLERVFDHVFEQVAVPAKLI